MVTNTKNTIDLSIIIVSWNTLDLLRKCLHSLYRFTKDTKFEIIVVDNNSPDCTADMVEKEFAQITLIRNTTNEGFAKANNQGIKISKGNSILLLNPDTLLADNAIDQMVAFLDTYDTKNLGIVTCELLNADFTHQPSVNKFYSFWNSFANNRLFQSRQRAISYTSGNSQIQEIDWAHGAVMLFTRDFMNKIGLLDERFYIYAEEIDYYLRAKKAGLINLYIENTTIIHLGGASSVQNRANMFIQNYRSFFQLLKKHDGWGGYFLYRLRSTFYLLFWYAYFSLKNREENKKFADVYAKTFLWNIGF